MEGEGEGGEKGVGGGWWVEGGGRRVVGGGGPHSPARSIRVGATYSPSGAKYRTVRWVVNR